MEEGANEVGTEVVGEGVSSGSGGEAVQEQDATAHSQLQTWRDSSNTVPPGQAMVVMSCPHAHCM